MYISQDDWINYPPPGPNPPNTNSCSLLHKVGILLAQLWIIVLVNPEIQKISIVNPTNTNIYNLLI
jgi:hypothetical protein